MSLKSSDLLPIGLWRASKHQEIQRRFPFTRSRSRWLPFGPLWTEIDRLRLYHALTPFREVGELAVASEVILAAAKRCNARSPEAVVRLLLALRYLGPERRSEAYRDPEAWLDSLGSLSMASVATALAQAVHEQRAA
jgi:hypothetical protein